MIECLLDWSVYGGGAGFGSLWNYDTLNGRLIGLENKNEGSVRVEAMRVADGNDYNDEIFVPTVPCPSDSDILPYA